MPSKKQPARDRILDAADQLARDQGPGNLSLEAVAARAGLSKGGLLYHFPTKAKLLQALVDAHLGEFDTRLREAEKRDPARRNALASAYLHLSWKEAEEKAVPHSGVLSAMADDPSFLDPVKAYSRSILDRLAHSADPGMALVAFLAIEGMRTTRLMGIDVMTEAETAKAYEALAALLDR